MNNKKKMNGTKTEGTKKVLGPIQCGRIKDDVILNELNMTSAKKSRQI